VVAKWSAAASDLHTNQHHMTALHRYIETQYSRFHLVLMTGLERALKGDTFF